jgi:hypothetical protein
MYLQACQVSHSEQLLEERVNILKMSERSLCVCITFTAVHLVTIKREAVIKAFRFGLCFLDELIAHRLDVGKLPRMRFEIRNDCHAGIIGSHKALSKLQLGIAKLA